MGMDAFTDDTNSGCSSNLLLEALVSNENGVEESSILLENLTRLDVKLAYSSEKLDNLELYRVIVSLGDFSMQTSNFMDLDIEKALILDLSLGYLDSEVAELRRFLNALRTEIIDAHKKMHSLGQRRETFTSFEGKLQTSEYSWKHLQEQLAGLERRLVNMRGTPFSQKNSYLHEDATFERSETDLQAPGQQRLVLKMLDKAISGELDLERQLLDSKEREKQLHLVVSELESFAEVALEKLLEAEHSSEVHMGIAKEMMTRLQCLDFNMHCSALREEELKSKLQSTLDQLKEKETALFSMESNFSELNQSIQEKEDLELKIRILEGKLQISESMLKEVNASYDVSQDQLSLMENTVETLRAHVFMVETRAQSAEDKLSTVTEENIELREELSFLKGGDENVDKLSLLKKQVRDLEVQLQTAKMSSEASLEQQNMLYTAIWDMEILIEELRTKVSKAEKRTDNAEKQCLELAEMNLKLNKDISCLKSDSVKLGESIEEANEVYVVRAKDINNGVELITEVVMQLASERERIQNQQSALARENKILLEEVRKLRKMCVKANQDNQVINARDFDDILVDSDTPGVGIAVSTVKEFMESSSSSTSSEQVDELTDEMIRDIAEASSCSTSDAVDERTKDEIIRDIANDETDTKTLSRHNNKKLYAFAAIFALVLSILAMKINWRDIASVIADPFVGF